MNNKVDKVVHKVRQCIDYQSLYAMEKDANSIGLTIQTTSHNRMILCKIKNHKPVADNIIDDYIFIGSLNTATNEISDGAMQKIIDWMMNNNGPTSIVKDMARVWRNGLKMYESSIRIMNEDINYIGDVIVEG